MNLYFTGFGPEILLGQRFIITLIAYFTGVRFQNIWPTNLDYNYYILRDLDFKIIRSQIWISIVIYLAGFELERTYLDYEFGLRLLDFTGFGL